MIQTTSRNKKKAFSTAAAVLLGAASVFGTHSCGGGGEVVVPGVTLSSSSVSEGNSGTTNLDFTVILSQATSTDITVSYATSDGTATAGQDYTATSGTLTIPANSTNATISIPVNGDLVLETDEIFNLEISNASNGTITNSSITVTGTIYSDDLAGYYTGSGSVNHTGTTLVIPDGDVMIIATDNRLVIINLDNYLVYIAPFTGFVDNTFTTTARVYENGSFVATTEISATFNTATSMALTLTGIGEYTTGSMSVAYSPENSYTPLVYALNGVWQHSTIGIRMMFNNSTTNIDILSNNSVESVEIEGCDAAAIDLSDVVSEQTGRIRSFSATTSASTCTDPAFDGTVLNGYFVPYETTLPDDRLLFIWFNDVGAHATILTEI